MPADHHNDVTTSTSTIPQQPPPPLPHRPPPLKSRNKTHDTPPRRHVSDPHSPTSPGSSQPQKSLNHCARSLDNLYSSTEDLADTFPPPPPPACLLPPPPPSSDVTMQHKDTMYGPQLRLNERGFLEQTHLNKTASSRAPVTSAVQNQHAGSQAMGIKQLRSASVDVTEQGAFSRSVPTTSYAQYSRTMSACALTPHAPGHVSGQSTCDSGIGSEATGSSERLARGASKTSLQSDVDPLDTVIPPLYATYAHCHERLFSDVPRKRTHRTGRTGPTQGLFTHLLNLFSPL